VTSVTEAPTSELSPPPRADDGEELDPELLELPDPPKRERSVVIAMLLFTAVASIAMIVSLRRDAAYAFSAAEPVEIGDLATAPASAFAENRFVRAHGMLGVAHAIRYERPLTEGSFRLMPVAGHPKLWTEVRVAPGKETVRYVPPEQLTGRLVRFGSAGPKHRGLASAVRDVTGQEVPPDAWLLVDGESPSSSRWAVLLVLLFAGFAVWNVSVTAKLLRRVR
jgi:hypothetical protein